MPLATRMGCIIICCPYFWILPPTYKSLPNCYGCAQSQSGRVLKVNFPFIKPFTFQSTVFYPNANPASSSSDSLSYSSATLWIKTTGAIDGRKSNNVRFFFLIPSVNRALKKNYGVKRMLREQFTLTALTTIYVIVYLHFYASEVKIP